MIKNAAILADFERSDTAEQLRNLSYEDALAIFEALWREAVMVNPGFHEDWRHDIQPTLAIARAVNGLPPAA